MMEPHTRTPSGEGSHYMGHSSDSRLHAVSFGKHAARALCAAACLALGTSSLVAQQIPATAVLAALNQGSSFSPSSLPEAPQPQAPAQQHPGTPAAPNTLCRITGVVSDIQGGLIPGAHVAAERTGAPKSETQETNAGPLGHFRFTELLPGSYTIIITMPGFETYRLQNIVLKPDEDYELPEVALPIARTEADATVTVTEEQLAEAELNDELHQRVLGILPNYYTSYIWDAAPLNTRQKFKLAIRSATDPVFFASTAITAGIQQANNTYPEYGDGVGGYFTRYAAAYGDAIVGRIVTSVLFNSLFHEDPRYFVMTNGSFPRRAFHAILSTVTQRGDDKHWHPAYANFLGDATTGLITSTWHPGSNIGTVVLNDTFYGLGGQAIRNLAREFLFRHLARHVPTYAKGRPPDEKSDKLPKEKQAKPQEKAAPQPAPAQPPASPQ